MDNGRAESRRIRITSADVEEALDVVQEVTLRTPTVSLPGPEDKDLFLKLENLQRLGAFKIRGAWNRMSRLTPAEARRGVTTVSSGKHGLAVAWAAKRLELPCVIRVPRGASLGKLKAIRATGARVRELGRERLVAAHMEEGWREWPETYVPPFAHPLVIAGQGTLGWELAEDVPDVRSVLVPVGGGGLASGVAIAVKSRRPTAKVFGVQAKGAASLPTALRTKSPFRVERPRTIADGIGVGLIIPDMVELLVRNLDGCFLVSEADIRRAMRRLALEAKTVSEPAGAAAFAAWVRYEPSLKPPVAVVVSGGNVAPDLLASVVG